jgi:hypothetical protein
VVVEPHCQPELRNAGFAKVMHAIAPDVATWAPPEHLVAAVRRQPACPVRRATSYTEPW